MRQRIAIAVLLAAVAVLLYRDIARQVADAEPAKPDVTLGEDDARRQSFELAYSQKQWGTNAQGKGSSGAGSTLLATRPYRVFLQDFMAAHQVRSVVDAGCGDWEFSRAIDWKGIDYLGLDIVAPVIEADQRRYGGAGIRFAVADIVRDELPAADLLLVKDVLQHLSNADIQRFLAKLPRYRHVLLVNDVDPRTLSADNVDIAAGRHRPLDLTRPPFSLHGAKVLVWQADASTKLVLHIQPAGSR